jgi:hypothetical protein
MAQSQKCTFNHYQEYLMTVLAKEMITNAEVGRMLSDREVSRFKPAEIREAIQSLVSEGKDALLESVPRKRRHSCYHRLVVFDASRVGSSG